MDLQFHSEPAPLEPALAWLIVESYDGPKDDEGRFHTTDEENPGTAKFKEGHTYKGSFAKGMMHGKGTYTWTDGTVFEGDFKWNVIEGEGTFSWLDGSKYVGEIEDGLRHGEGTFTGPNGTPSYTGSWKHGKRHGSGTLWYDTDRDCYYEGDWVDNQRHGQGRMHWKPKGLLNLSMVQGGPRKKRTSNHSPTEGNMYNGTWEYDMKSGMGTMEWYDRGEKYVGMWANDQQNGQGEHIWIENPPDGNTVGTQKQMSNRYVGEWLDGERHGEGVFTYASGARYEGLWARNCKEGYGVLTFEDGHVYEGPFLADRLVEPDVESPLYGKDETMQPQLRLHVNDLFPASEDAVAGRLRLERTVLRYTSELKVVYKWYCGLRHGAYPPSAGIFALSMLQFKQLWLDCSLGAYGVSFVMVHRLAAAMRAQHVSEVKGFALARKDKPYDGKTSGATVATDFFMDPAAYSPDTPLLFREFVELLARIAVVAFSNAPPVQVSRPAAASVPTPSSPSHSSSHSSHHSTTPNSPSKVPPKAPSPRKVPQAPGAFLQPADAFSQLMTQAISGKHGEPFVKGSFAEALRDPDTASLFQRHDAKIRKCFDAWASPSGLLSLGAMLRLFNAAGAAASKTSGGLGLSENDVIRVLVVDDADFPLEADPTLLDREFLYVDFLDALAHIAHSHAPAELPPMISEAAEDDENESGDTLADNNMPGVRIPLYNHLNALINKLDFEVASAGPKRTTVTMPPRLSIALTASPDLPKDRS